MNKNNQHGLKEFEAAMTAAGFTRIYDIVDYEVFTRQHGMVAYIANYVYGQNAPANTRRCDLMVADHSQDRDAVRRLLHTSMSVWARTPNTPVDNMARPKDKLQASDEWFDLWITFDAAVPRAASTNEPEVEQPKDVSTEEEYLDENGEPVEIIVDDDDTVVVSRPLTMAERPNVTVPWSVITRNFQDKLMGRTPRT